MPGLNTHPIVCKTLHSPLHVVPCYEVSQQKRQKSARERAVSYAWQQVQRKILAKLHSNDGVLAAHVHIRRPSRRPSKLASRNASFSIIDNLAAHTQPWCPCRVCLFIIRRPRRALDYFPTAHCQIYFYLPFTASSPSSLLWHSFPAEQSLYPQGLCQNRFLLYGVPAEKFRYL